VTIRPPARWKEPIIEARWRLDWPRRRQLLAQREREGTAPVVVLAWHRIASDRATSWTCSFARFRDQVSWIEDRHDVVSLEEAQRRVREGNARTCVALTFDDGYAESLDRAVPLLLERRLPFTWFATTRHATERAPLEHDLEHGLRFPVAGVDALRDLARAGAEIGGHTRTHADVAGIADRARLWDEIVESGRDLAREVGVPVRRFAFAFGAHRHLSREGFEVAREGGYLAACSAYGGYNLPGDDAFHLQRIPVTDDLARLRDHLALSPRQLAIERFGAPE
jgi:peptidoglycan/xylan/chitin deacetylase (PgdA/CDA1 family)